jgi:hypothetical protein
VTRGALVLGRMNLAGATKIAIPVLLAIAGVIHLSRCARAGLAPVKAWNRRKRS